MFGNHRRMLRPLCEDHKRVSNSSREIKTPQNAIMNIWDNLLMKQQKHKIKQPNRHWELHFHTKLNGANIVGSHM